MDKFAFILAVIKEAFRFALQPQPKGYFTMSLILTEDQKIGLSIAPKSKKGNPAKLDGVPVWESSDAAILGVTAAADGLSASVAAAGALGTAQVSVRGDADLGAGVREIIGMIDVEVVGGEATIIEIATGSPEPQ